MDDDAELSMAALVRDGVVRVRRQSLTLARVVRRSWWRRLLAWRPWAPAPAPWELPARRVYERPCVLSEAMAAGVIPSDPEWFAVVDGVAHRIPPAPRSLPSDGMPCAR